MTIFQQLMKHFGLTTRTMARKVGMSRTAISEIALGRRLPRVDQAIRIARQLDVSVEELWITKNWVDKSQEPHSNEEGLGNLRQRTPPG